MGIRYAIYIHKDSKGFSGFVPDVSGVYFAGSTLNNCLDDAKSAIIAHFELLQESGQEIPSPKSSSFYDDDLECKGGQWYYIRVKWD